MKTITTNTHYLEKSDLLTMNPEDEILVNRIVLNSKIVTLGLQNKYSTEEYSIISKTLNKLSKKERNRESKFPRKIRWGCEMKVKDALLVFGNDELRITAFKEKHGTKTVNKQTILSEMISNYNPYNEQEEIDKEVMLKWLSNSKDVLTIDNEFAHFTSSAFVVNNDRNKALMIYHNIYDSWAWTGGHIDGEIDMLGVALRELQEETGIKNIRPVITEIFLLDTLPVLGHVKKDKYVSAHTHLSVAYLIEADEKDLLIVKEDENSGVEWIPIEKVVEKSSELYMKPVYEKAIKKLKLLK